MFTVSRMFAMVPGLSVTEWWYRRVLVIVFERFLSCFEMVCLKISADCFYVRGFLFCQADGRCLSGAPVELVLPVPPDVLNRCTGRYLSVFSVFGID